MPATYCLLSDVKKILRSSGRERIRFSEDGFKSVNISFDKAVAVGNPWRNRVSNETDYSVSFDWSQLTFSTSFRGFIKLHFVFTSPTEFQVYHNKVQSDGFDKRSLLYGTGDISTTFDYMGLIQVPASTWGGTIVPGVVVTADFEADISDEDAEFFMENAEIDIDNMCAGGRLHYLQPGETRMFVYPDIPPLIKMVAEYMSAYYIYSGVFAEEIADGAAAGKMHFSERWKVTAVRSLSTFIAHKTRLPPGTKPVSETAFADLTHKRVQEWLKIRAVSVCDFKTIREGFQVIPDLDSGYE